MESKPSPQEKSYENYLTFKRSYFYGFMVIMAFGLGILLGYVVWGNSNPPARTVAAEPTEDAQAPAVPQQVKRYEIPSEGFQSVGPKEAPIVLVEFSDFGCSFCAKWHNETYATLMAAYPGQIRFVYRNVPFRAFDAAEASLCAAEQNSYWQYHDKLFSYEHGLDQAALLQYAEDLELNLEAFTACLEENRYQDVIQEDMDFATNLGVNSTPTFFVNGLPLIGAQPLSAFKQVIDKELAGEYD
ncbi:MAG: DsbA family protein [Anaerolineales bacterium]|nr:DsbA family protein [Anaerolineales bacterium]